MKTKFSKLTFAAGFALAMAFTFNGCGPSKPMVFEPVVYMSMEYGGQTYKTVKIGDRVWMAENLNYAVGDSKCYGEGGQELLDDATFNTLSAEETQANCAKYGRLYSWTTAMALPANCKVNYCDSQHIQPKHKGICPTGWHIPNKADRDALSKSAGGGAFSFGGNNTGNVLKAKNGWNSGAGEDNLGFAALPGGVFGIGGDIMVPGGNSIQTFNSIDRFSSWWTAIEAPLPKSPSNVSPPHTAYSFEVYYNQEGAKTGIRDKINMLSIRCVQD